jgi:predicted dehydrogenase
MAPIRICIVGLAATSSAGYKTGEWGIQHLNSLQSSPYYQVVGICNSSLASSQKSIESHKLGSDVKAYSSFDEVVSDPGIDMVSIVVAIGKHYQLVKPLLQQKKNVLVEFPIAPTVAEVEELATLAKSAGVKAISGSQGRAHPVFRRMKDLIGSGAIGDVVFSTLNGHNALAAAPMWPESQSVFLDINSGISRLHLVVGHSEFYPVIIHE